MKASLPVILIATHLLALGAGWWCLRPSDPRPDSTQETSRASKQSERSARKERRVSAEDLLAAYEKSDFWGEAMKRRSEASKPPEAPPNGSPEVYIPPEQRAAEITDIAGAMQKELEAMDGGKSYDYMLAKALIARWMKEDPAACAAWLGQMKMRTGWGDPFDAFAKSMPPVELIKLMDQGWLKRNRRMALDSLADQVGEAFAADLPAVLSALSDDDAKLFLEHASAKARVEDAAVWVKLLVADPHRLQTLADQWIRGPGSNWQWKDGAWVPSGIATADWQEKAELVLAAAVGTPAEEIFRRQLEVEQEQSERGRELARIAREPAEATAALIDLYVGEGHDEAEARSLASQAIAESYRDGLEVWQKEAWSQDLQLSLLGQRKLDEALAARLEAIATELPEVLQAGTRNRTWSDAMMIDPAVTLAVARQSGRVEEALQSATKLVGDHDTSIALKAEIFLTLSEQGLWNQGGQFPNAKPFYAEYLRDDPEAARVWIGRLPASLSQAVKEVAR
jgi:hypothetical protein